MPDNTNHTKQQDSWQNRLCNHFPLPGGNEKEQLYKLRNIVNLMRIDSTGVEDGINTSFRRRVKQMKLVRKEKHWTLQKWEEWHEKLSVRKGMSIRLARRAISTKNKTIDKLIAIIDELINN